MAPLKNLIFDYLSESYPNSYKKNTKFGLVLVLDKESDSVHGHRIVDKLTDLFSCSYSEAFGIWHDFLSSRPELTNIENSTNENVLIFKSLS